VSPSAKSAAALRLREAARVVAPEDDQTASPQGHRELRVWLRLLACASKIESLLSLRLRKEFKTSMARFDALAQLERFPDGLTMSELSRRLMVSNGAITGLVDRLVAEGLVLRQGDPRDRRSVIVRLTRKGREGFFRMARRHEEWVVAILGELSAEAQSGLLRNLTLLKRSLDMPGSDTPPSSRSSSF
jgi:DNA-binding MarR family transcriptional regulator